MTNLLKILGTLGSLGTHKDDILIHRTPSFLFPLPRALSPCHRIVL